MKPRVTSKDVAKLANVSQATVSYVLNNNKSHSISEETKQKILDAARELNYTPNVAARTLKSNKTNCICVAISRSLSEPRYSNLVQGIRSILEDANYNITLCNSKKYMNNFPNYLDIYLQNRADAIIYIGAAGVPIEPESLDYIVQNKIPLVIFGYNPPNDNIPTININYFYGAYEGAKHLISQGYKNIIYFRPNINTIQEIQREQGVSKASKESTSIKLNIIEIPIRKFNSQSVNDNNTIFFDNQHNWINDFINLASPITDNINSDTAIICSWPRMTEIISRIFIKKNLTIPVLTLEKIELFSNDSENFIFSCLPNYDIGKECAKAVLKLLNDPNDIYNVLLNPKLEINNSIL